MAGPAVRQASFLCMSDVPASTVQGVPSHERTPANRLTCNGVGLAGRVCYKPRCWVADGWVLRRHGAEVWAHTAAAHGVAGQVPDGSRSTAYGHLYVAGVATNESVLRRGP